MLQANNNYFFGLGEKVKNGFEKNILLPFILLKMFIQKDFINLIFGLVKILKN